MTVFMNTNKNMLSAKEVLLLFLSYKKKWYIHFHTVILHLNES